MSEVMWELVVVRAGRSGKCISMMDEDDPIAIRRFSREENQKIWDKPEVVRGTCAEWWALRARIEELEEALKPFAIDTRRFDGYSEEGPAWCSLRTGGGRGRNVASFSNDQFKAARAALRPIEKETE